MIRDTTIQLILYSLFICQALDNVPYSVPRIGVNTDFYLWQIMARIPFLKEFDDFAEATANPNPDRPIYNAVGNFGRAVCDRISARPDIFAPTILQSPLRAACQPYWDKNGFDGPELPVSVTGGQCPGVSYSVVLTGTNNVNGNPFTLTPGNFVGPIRRVEFGSGSAGPCGNQVLFEYKFVDGNGQVIVQATGCGPIQGTIALSATPVNPAAEPPGGCGPAPPDGPAVPGNNPAPDPGPLPPGTGPRIDIRGNPILVLPPTLEIAPNVEITLTPGEINLGSGVGGGVAGTPEPGLETPGEGSGAGGGDNDFEEPPDGERWVGCCVHIVQRPVGHGSIPQSEPETIFPDIVGNVRLKFSSTLQIAEYDTPLINKQKTTCIWEPVRGLQIVGVRVNLRPGFLYSYTPYSVPESN